LIVWRDESDARNFAALTTPDAGDACPIEAGVTLEATAWVSLVCLPVAVIIEPVAKLERGKNEPLALRIRPVGAGPKARGTDSDSGGLRCRRIALLREGRAVILFIRLPVAIVIATIADLKRRRNQTHALREAQFAAGDSRGALARELGEARLACVDDELVEDPVTVVIEPIAALGGARVYVWVVVRAVRAQATRASAITVVVFIDAKISGGADPRAVAPRVQQEDAPPSLFFASTVIRAKTRAKVLVELERGNAESAGTLAIRLTFLAELGTRAIWRAHGVEHGAHIPDIRAGVDARISDTHVRSISAPRITPTR
jgi:hypothetical protein